MAEQLEQYMRTLKLSGMAKEWRSVVFQDPEQYIRELLELELREREVNRINRMVKTAGFQVIKTLEDFAWNQNIELPVGLTKEDMEGLQFLPQKENLIFLGSVGTGKTHLATAIALKACQAGRRVRFFTAASLANLLLERNNKGTLNSFLENLVTGLHLFSLQKKGQRGATLPGHLRLLRAEKPHHHFQSGIQPVEYRFRRQPPHGCSH